MVVIHGLVDKCDREATVEYMASIKSLLQKGCVVVYFSEAVYPNFHLKTDRFIMITREKSQYENQEIK